MKKAFLFIAVVMVMAAASVSCNKSTSDGYVPVESISFQNASLTCAQGLSRLDEIKLGMVIQPKNATDKSVTWTVENPEILEWNGGQRKFDILSVGETTVTARTNDGGKTASLKIIVKPEPYVYVQSVEKGDETAPGKNDGWAKLHCVVINYTGFGISQATATLRRSTVVYREEIFSNLTTESFDFSVDNLAPNEYTAEIVVLLNSPGFEMNSFKCHWPIRINQSK